MTGSNTQQKEFWEAFASSWVNQQVELDGLMAPVLDEILARAELQPGQRVLDIGCGTGTSTLRAAEAVAPGGSVLGADISEPMLDYARHRAADMAAVEFATVDAAEFDFPSAHFDQVVSRFGVMFFSDPVLAFRNIARALKPGARLTMACWSVLDANPWFRVPMYAAKAQLGAPPAVDPDAPGPLAFRDVERVIGILQQAGFSDPQAAVEPVTLTPPGSRDAVARHAVTIGPASRAIRHFEATEADVYAIIARVKDDMAPFATPAGMRVPAEINFFSALAPL